MMDLLKEFDQRDRAATGRELHRLAAKLFPICRSITGEGLRQSLSLIQQRIPLQTTEVPTGTQVFDWTVPKEWNIRDAFVKGPRSKRVVDFKKNNLHVMSYSVPVRATMTLEELKAHLFSLPDKPDWIPYRTSYYKEDWGFCLSHKQMLELEDGEYEVCIDSSLKDGHLTLGECYLRGRFADEVLISCHACHPSLANDNLSGCSNLSGAVTVPAGSPLLLSLSFHSGDYRRHCLAGAKSRYRGTHPTWPGIDVRRRRGRIPLQEKPD